MPDYLLLIALGPVQDFIMTARRTRDLWFGSYLLSEVSKAVAKNLAGQTLIFPNPLNISDLEPSNPESLNVCNIILCQLNTDSEEKAREFARQAVEAAKNRLRQIRNVVLDDVLNLQGVDRKKAE